ncbi:hypothetical protein PG984_011778 [Apiospora sp. TS-2023a]
MSPLTIEFEPISRMEAEAEVLLNAAGPEVALHRMTEPVKPISLVHTAEGGAPSFRTLAHPSTTHGDTHIRNIYFTATGEIGFLGWSAFHFDSCFHDIVYHMTAMLSIEDRRTHEMEILDRLCYSLLCTL